MGGEHDKLYVEDDTFQVKARVEAGNGLVTACSVYWSSINGLTKNLIDKMRLAGFEGEPALVVTMAGAGGKDDGATDYDVR